MRIIFLDFDGVLNNAKWIHDLKESGVKFTSWIEKDYREIDPSRVKMVSDLAIETQAKIVVSSSWRIINPLDRLQDYLRKGGMDESVLPIDVTPRANGRDFRGDEIIMWLDNHPEVTSHVIFDDDGDFYPLQPLVKTSWDGGLCEDHVDIARGILLNTNGLLV